MDFSEKIAELTKKVRNIGDTLGTEEATKNALVMPFIAALGYDVFNPGSVSAFGSCEAKVDGNRFEPPARSKGQVARAAFYMADSYAKYRLSRQQEQLFRAWDKMYPVDQWECTRAKRIERLQGNENRFVKEPCQQAGLW